MSNKEVDKVRNHAAKGKEEKSRESPSNSTSEFSDVQTALDSRLDEATRQSIGSLSPKRIGESYRTSSRSPKDGKYRSSRRLSPRRSPREKNKDKKSSKRTSERLANPPLHQDRHSYSEAEGSYDELSHDRRHDYHSSRKKSSRTNKSAHELSPHKRNGDGEGDSSDIHHHHHHHRSRKSSRPLIEKGSSERVSSKSPHRRGSHGHRSSRRRISDPKDDPESPKPVGRHARASPHRKNYGDGEDLDVSPIGKPPLVKGKASRKLDLLYGIDDEDAKAKEKARRGHSERHINPGVEHVNSSNSAALSTLYGDASDADAKAKAKASKGGVVVSPSMATTSSKSNTTVTTLYGNHDNDAKLKAKASCRSSPLASPGVESISLFSKESSAISTLYSSTADANAKARAGKGGLMIASMPGVESVHHDGSLASAAVTLYGRDAEIKAKAKAGSSGVVSKIGLAGAVTSESLENTSHTSRESTGSAGSLPSANVHPKRKVNNVGASEAMEGFSMPNDPNAATEYVVHENKKRKDRRRLLVFLFLLLLIGAGVAVWYFLFRNGDINSDNSQIQSSDVLDPTSTPSFSGAASLMPVGLRVSSIPSSFPSNQPSKQLLYERPSESDCEAIANNQTIAGREQMEYANFGLDLEVVLVDNITMTEPLLEELMKAIQEKILPSLAGCSIVLDRFLEAWRFVIFDAFVKGSVQQEESCIDEAMVEQNCHRVFAELALFLKGSVRFLDIIRLISDEQENFANNLGLSDSFLVVKMIGAKGLTPTASPTVMPSGLPSSPPSELPTEEPSVNPSSIISSTPPTMVPSIEPTDSPTLVASIAPSLTPSTGAPSLTQSTGMPSWSPSLQPTEFPTESPSSMPTKTLTKNPTPGPTRNPTPRPTVRPTPPPTRLPTVSPATSSPSLPPTSRPSLAPSAMPSRNPTAAPSSRPSATVNFWAICGRQGRCREANSLQNVIWNRYGGQVIGTEIAVRCCSDTPLPGFRIMRSMLSGTLCPYAASEVAGVCYNSATWSEAKALCSSVGARLCTKFELENDCTTNSGCWHDYRFAWSSTN